MKFKIARILICVTFASSVSAMAAGLAAGSIGTETDGSITCPASLNGVVRFKPTVGLVSRRYVVPISHSQEAATADADTWRGDYSNGLLVDGLKGMRIGVMRTPNVDAALFDAAHATLKAGSAFSGPSASQLPAVAGFPHLTVPMGLSAGLPVGLSFIGPKWHDHAVLKAGYAYEQLSKARVTPQLRPTLGRK